MTTADLATLNVLQVLHYECPVVNRRKAIPTRFSTGIAL